MDVYKFLEDLVEKSKISPFALNTIEDLYASLEECDRRIAELYVRKANISEQIKHLEDRELFIKEAQELIQSLKETSDGEA